MSLQDLFFISRPRFWMYIFGPFLIGYTAAHGIHIGTDILFIFSCIYFLCIANFLVYGVNDLFDQDTDIYNTKKGVKEYKLNIKNKKYLINLLLLSFFLSIIYAYFLSNFARIFFATFIFLSISYSAPPIRFKARPILDFLSNGLYIVPACIGYTLNTNNLPNIEYVIASFTWAFAMHIFSAIPDIKADNNAKLKTTAVILGFDKSLLLCTILWTVSAFFATKISVLFIVAWIYVIICLYVFVHKSYITKIYWLFPLINTVMGFVLFCYTVWYTIYY